MKMDALVKAKRERGLWLERVDVPTLNEGEALVKIHKTAICGTDVHIYEWNAWAEATIPTPMVVGHEFVGEIVEIKGKSDAFKVGDLVSAEGHVVCGHCKNCLRGDKHNCANAKGIGVNRPGIFAEYAAIPLENLWKCESNIPEDMYAIFDPFGNATHTALAFPVLGEDVLITGAGAIGVMAAAICKHAGARNVVITNRSDWRLDFAKEVVPGVITVNTKKTTLKEVQKELGMKEGFDVGLEMSGNITALNDMVDNMINGGKIALLGLGLEGGLAWDKFIFKGITVQGIYGRKVFETWRMMTSMIQSGLDISKIITHHFDYKDFEKGFELMEGKKCGKIILEWNK